MSRPDLPPLPRPQGGGPAFAAPWAARAFAIVVHLADRGLFTWPEWAAALAAELAAGPEPGAADAYNRAWVRALERMLGRAAVTTPQAIDVGAQDWERAAAATPHGTPLRLANARRA